LTNKALHIVSLDVPFPADYGGAIDIYYRIKALHELGFMITLHCFEYGRGKHKELDRITSCVHYYKREKRIFDLIGQKPFIVQSRSTDALLHNLLQDNTPILFEGLHTTFFLADDRLKDRVKLVRTHNVEHQYYNGLADKATGLKKRYFRNEARKLKKFEQILKNADHILTIQKNDFNHFSALHKSVYLLNASAPENNLNEYVETEPYCLFHGNLSIPENNTAACWMLETFKQIPDIPLIIAGKDPSKMLAQKCTEQGVSLEVNPGTKNMNVLLGNARVHVLHTDQPTGLKLKLLAALQTSGHVVVNVKMTEGTGLDTLCTVATSRRSFSDRIIQLFPERLAQEDFLKRRKHIDKNYDTKKNCEIIAQLISD